MLRASLLLLVLANLLYAAWAAGGLRNFGLMPASPREPERMTRQIEPQALRLAPPATSPASAPASAPETAAMAPAAPQPAASPTAATPQPTASQAAPAPAR